MKPPCMIVVQNILPALRFEITRKLVEKYGMKRSDAAEKMGMTPAAITQYMNRVRGDSAASIIEGSESVMAVVDEIAADIAGGGSPIDSLLAKLCWACTLARSEKLICTLHKEAVPGLRSVEGCSCSKLTSWT